MGRFPRLRATVLDGIVSDWSKTLGRCLTVCVCPRVHTVGVISYPFGHVLACLGVPIGEPALVGGGRVHNFWHGGPPSMMQSGRPAQSERPERAGQDSYEQFNWHVRRIGR